MAAFLREADGLPEVVAHQEDLRRALSLAPGDVVLDVGCGAGSHAARVARGHDGPVLGLDREAMLDRGPGRARRRGGVDRRGRRGHPAARRVG